MYFFYQIFPTRAGLFCSAFPFVATSRWRKQSSSSALALVNSLVHHSISCTSCLLTNVNTGWNGTHATVRRLQGTAQICSHTGCILLFCYAVWVFMAPISQPLKMHNPALIPGWSQVQRSRRVFNQLPSLLSLSLGGRILSKSDFFWKTRAICCPWIAA